MKFKSDWGCSEKLVVSKRCSPDKLKFNIARGKGYVILRDAYSEDPEEAIYFVVKMSHPAKNEDFLTRLFGREPKEDEVLAESAKPGRVGKDRHKNIVIFARWRQLKHSHYRVYTAELNSRMVCFMNAPDA